MFYIACVHRGINMSLNKTDSCISITQLRLVTSVLIRSKNRHIKILVSDSVLRKDFFQ